VYIGAARNLLSGQGLTIPFGETIGEPMTHHAPLYPAILSIIGAMNADPIDGSRWLNVFLVGANILLIGLVIYTTTFPPLWLTPVGILVVLLSIPFLSIHVMAWTEPLFILLGSLGIVCLAYFIDSPHYKYLVLSGIFIGFAILTRYAGIAYLFTGIAGILVLAKEVYRRRFIHTAIFALIGVLPVLFWAVRNSLTSGTATNRELLFHPITKDNVFQAIDTLSLWVFIPSPTSVWLKIAGLMVVLLLVIVPMIIVFRHERSNPSAGEPISNETIPTIIKSFMLFAFLYSSFLIFSISFLDANTPLDQRILSPLYLAIILPFFYLVARLWRAAGTSPASRLVIITLMAVFCLFSVIQGTNRAIDNYRQGIGLNSVSWRNSGTIEQVRILPDNVTIYSNLPHAVYFRAGRSAYSLPHKFDSVNRRENPNYTVDLATMQRQIENPGGMVVLFTSFNYSTLLGEEELLKAMPLKVIAETNDGRIYAFDADR
jgi:hypothetical protein